MCHATHVLALCILQVDSSPRSGAGNFIVAVKPLLTELVLRLLQVAGGGRSLHHTLQLVHTLYICITVSTCPALCWQLRSSACQAEAHRAVRNAHCVIANVVAGRWRWRAPSSHTTAS